MTGTFNPAMTNRFGSPNHFGSSLAHWYLSVARPVAAKSVSGFNVVSDDRHNVKELLHRFAVGLLPAIDPSPRRVAI